MVNEPDPEGPESFPGRDNDRQPGEPERPIVLATAGGGEDGAALLETFVEASRGADWRGVVVAGSLASRADQERLRRLAASAGVPYRSFVRNLCGGFGRLGALVCMGGYNTLGEALAQATPTVCVPRVHPRREQLLRARAFAGLGLLRLVHPAQLDAASLRREVDAALGDSRARIRADVAAHLHFDGAARAAQHLTELASSGDVAARLARPA